MMRRSDYNSCLAISLFHHLNASERARAHTHAFIRAGILSMASWLLVGDLRNASFLAIRLV